MDPRHSVIIHLASLPLLHQLLAVALCTTPQVTNIGGFERYVSTVAARKTLILHDVATSKHASAYAATPQSISKSISETDPLLSSQDAHRHAR
jgi:hypothetical protein